jgi:predicted dinucleotide-binding enzyme
MEINMTYAIIGTGLVGATLARFFVAKDIPVLIANSRGPETLGELTAELGVSVKAVTVDEAVEADIILVAVGAVAFKDIGAMLQDWSGKIVIDVTNGFMLPPEVQQAEYQGRLTSEVNAERVPGAKLVKAFNQLPLKVHCPTMSVEESCSSRATMRMRVRPSPLLRKTLVLQLSKSARLQKVAA